ncbi:MAG: hypothetical protein WCI74_09285 [Actinomycetes bacterium]
MACVGAAVLTATAATLTAAPVAAKDTLPVASSSPTASASPKPSLANDAWMSQPEAAALMADMTKAQADFESAHKQKVAADKAIAELTKAISDRSALATAAQLQIQQYARAAYISSTESNNLEAITDLLATADGQNAAVNLAMLAYVGGSKAQELLSALNVLREVQELKKRQQELESSAARTMNEASTRAQELLDKLNSLLPPRTNTAKSTTPKTCPKKAPPGSLTDGSAAIGVRELCRQSVKQARSAGAAAAIVWAFNHLGVKYTTGGVPINDENFDGFACATFVAKAFYWGAGVGGFLELPWTPAYATSHPFLMPMGNKHKSGDINVMWRSGTMASSGGQAGHAQLFIADGWIIQSGGTGGATNVARYPNGWPGWQETHFALTPVID